MSSFSLTRNRRGAWNDPHACRRRRRALTVTNSTVAAPTLARIADAENLIPVLDRLRRHAGQAPGPDGETFSQIGRSEGAALMRELSKMLRTGTYRPGPARCVSISKGPGRGSRTLNIRNIPDRVVSAALHAALTPWWERVFMPNSFGFRPRRGVWHLLTRLEASMIREARWVLVVDDIRDAFGSVVIADALDDHRRILTEESLLSLIEVVLRGHERPDRRVGIAQGRAYSPTVLNGRTHFAHDLAIGQGTSTPLWYRYADNLVYSCRSVTEGHQILDRASTLLGKAGFRLKGKDGPPTDLRLGGAADLLGFKLSYRHDRLVFGLGEEAWEKLERGLESAHQADDPPATARATVRGWIDAQGPAFESLRNDLPGRVLRTITEGGFQGLFALEAIRGWWEDAGKRWETFHRKVSQRSSL